MSVLYTPHLLSICLQVSFAAGRAIRHVVASKKLGMVDKGKNDPCTLADLEAQKVIVGSLRWYFPEVEVIGEEKVDGEKEAALTKLNLERISRDILPASLLSLPAKEVTIWVDPLDGTKGLMEANYFSVTSLIGISYRGKPICGFIHEPFSSPPITHWGGPSITLRKSVKLSAANDFPLCPALPPRTFSIVTSFHHATSEHINFLRTLNPAKMLSFSGCGYKSLMVVRGEASLYVNLGKGTMKWDTCASEAVVRAVGGVFTDVRGKDFTYNPSDPPDNPAGPVASLDASIHSLLVQQHQRYFAKP